NYEVGPNNEHNEAYYNGIMAMSSDEELKAKLTRKYEKVKLLAKGMPSPVFENYENHKGGEMSLTDLKGKYVYVDVWATWCGPCKREIPYLKEVEAKYHNNNIEFVSTSIDKAKDHSAWVEMVKDKELGGIQLFADNDWNSKFVTDYAIEGIPRFLLIDPEGNIVTADAPRPSDPKLVKLFEELKL
ncbi:MAG: TlpA family protein disulfide reductase, partial [Bacteroidia bacterium]|nr:TlpA family protein disulfide reductase [Bacteroidia bacterium]